MIGTLRSSSAVLRRLRNYCSKPYNVLTTGEGKCSLEGQIKLWNKGVTVDEEAIKQLKQMSFFYDKQVVRHPIAAMADCHSGVGAVVGCVLPCSNSVVPACVGVDIGCGIVACPTSLRANDLPDSLLEIQLNIECAIPHGRSHNGRPHSDVGGWSKHPRESIKKRWDECLAKDFESIVRKYPAIGKSNSLTHLGTLGSGNHYLEICLDTQDYVWITLHVGSRGVGNKIGMTFIELARNEMKKTGCESVSDNLAYLREGDEIFDDYMQAVSWAQKYALINRQIMLDAIIDVLKNEQLPPFIVFKDRMIDCHHNYVRKEIHFGEPLYIIRKGAISARTGELGIIPSSMGSQTYIVRGKGNPEAYSSASHGAGRKLSRGEAKRKYNVEDHNASMKNIYARRDKNVIDETPMAYKDIDAVMAAQNSLVEEVNRLRQVICIKG